MSSDRVNWYFDFVSPFAYLQFKVLARDWPELSIQPVPVLFAGLLGHFGQKGPAEIPGKREHTYRHCVWLADKLGLEFKMPAAHPFNPLVPLRYSILYQSRVDVIDALFDGVFKAGYLPAEDAYWAYVSEASGMEMKPDFAFDDATKLGLRKNTEQAIETGVFGVPTLQVHGVNHWGVDSTEMAVQGLADPDKFAGGEFERVTNMPWGLPPR